MTNSSFYTSAGNFIGTAQGGVDSRTGLFNVSLPLVRLPSGQLAGPSLSLTLQYSPLSLCNEGFGTGFNLNLTRYDTTTGRLVLSTSEEYRIHSDGATVKQKKLDNFLFYKMDDKHCRVVYKNGVIEELSLHKSIYIPEKIISPDGRGFHLQWNSDFSVPRLTKIIDIDGTILCTVSYPDKSVASTIFSVLPEDKEAGYKLIFNFQQEKLTELISHVTEPPLVWTYEYDDVGPHRNWRAITKIITPTGLIEQVEYYTNKGMAFPDIADIPDLPCVFEHTLIPGCGQPPCTTRWHWTQKNFLGKDAGMQEWQPDTDQMLNILLGDYHYGSTAEVIDTSQRVLCSTTRTYNNYHLLVDETRNRDGKIYSQSTQYHALPGVSFADQPSQLALPKEQKEIWRTAQSNDSRTRITQWRFDNSGNPVYQLAADGTITEYTYYPAEGEDGACPADPWGFVRYLKCQTVTPVQAFGDEPVHTTIKTWKKIDAINGEHFVVMPDTVSETTGVSQSLTLYDYYDDPADTLRFGREKTIIHHLIPDTSCQKRFTSTQTFSYDKTNRLLIQTDTFTGHDTLSATHVSRRHLQLGLVLSQTSALNVTTTSTYDKAGRQLFRTTAPGTAYENTASWQYTLSGDGPVITELDAFGNQKRTHFDKAGRCVRQYLLDSNDTHNWYETFSRQYNPVGEVSSSSQTDWFPRSADKFQTDMAQMHNGWGIACIQQFSDGEKKFTDVDPVLLKRSEYAQIRDDNYTGVSTSHYDEKSVLPVRHTRHTASGEIDGTSYYSWDGLGRLRHQKDELNNESQWTYDIYGRVLTQTLPDGSVISRTYAPHLTGKQLASISVTGPDADGNIQTWLLGTQEFDSLGRLLKQTSGGRTTTYRYDAASPVPAAITLPSGKTVSYTYIPELGNALSSLTTEGITQTFIHDKRTGELLREQEGDISNEYIWNISGSLQQEVFSRGPVRHEVSYTSSIAGEAVSYQDITGKQTKYVRNTFGQVISMIDDALTVDFQYDALGRLMVQTATDNNTKSSLTTSLTYDDFGRETERHIADSNGTTLVLTQSWQPNNLLSSSILSQNGTNIREEHYHYDNRNRLTGYTVTGTNSPADAYGHVIAEQRWHYDALNNHRTVTTVLSDGTEDVMIYFYSNPKDPTQLTMVTHTHPGYPACIKLKYDPEGRMIQDEAGRKLEYDTLGRLKSVDGHRESGGTYQYDAANRLVSQHINAGETHRLYYRHGELVNEEVQSCFPD